MLTIDFAVLNKRALSRYRRLTLQQITLFKLAMTKEHQFCNDTYMMLPFPFTRNENKEKYAAAGCIKYEKE